MFFIKGLLFFKPKKDFTDKFIVNTAVMITLVSFLFMSSGCSYYRAVTKSTGDSGNVLTETINKLYPVYNYPRENYPESNLQKLFFIDYTVFVVDSAGRWLLTEGEITGDTLFATANLSSVPSDNITDIPEDGISVKYKPSEEGDLLKRIFIYTDKVAFNQNGKAYFSLDDVSKIILFKDYPGLKIGLTFLIIGGVLTITLVTLFLIAFSEGIHWE